MFGLPWLVTLGEAEAQCAQLDAAGPTEGTITEYSDIWLFGGTRMYKIFLIRKNTWNSSAIQN